MNTTTCAREVKPCPFCGFQPDIADPDFIYPLVVDRTLWGAHCPTPAGGCDASVLASTRDGALLHWNRRPGDPECS
jgi:hypothetical protein